MSALSKPSCPRCGSDNVLPFEDEDVPESDATLFIVFLSAFLLFAGYLIFMISSYLFFPAVVIISIIITTRMINRREKQRKVSEDVERNYMCVDCGGFFKGDGVPTL